MSKASKERFQAEAVAKGLSFVHHGRTKVVQLDPSVLTGARARKFRENVATYVDKGKACEKGADPICEWFDLGPEEAGVLLSMSPGNRHIGEASVSRYVRAIVDGSWHKVHQDFGFDWTGAFRDGHHRATAIIRAKKPIRVRITFGLSPDAVVHAVDQGNLRSIAQQLAMKHGLGNAAKVVATVRAFLRLCSASPMTSVSYSVAEVEKGMEFCHDALIALDSIMKLPLPASFCGAVMLAWFVEPDVTRKFAEDVSRGTGLNQGDPAWTMREFLKNRDSAGTKNAFGIQSRTLSAIRAKLEDRPLFRFSIKDDVAVLEWFLKQRRRLPKVGVETNGVSA